MPDSRAERLAWVRGLVSAGAVRSIRTSAGLSLREMAASVADHLAEPEAGLSPTTVLRWEEGARPTGDRALAYAVVLEQLTTTRTRRRAAS